MTALLTREQLQRNLKSYQIGYVLAKNNYERTHNYKWLQEMHEFEQFIQTHKGILATVH